VFALGRAQELLLILDEFWQANKDLHSIPIYYASRLASKAIRVYQTYINMMNQHIRRQMDVANPFKFQHITNMKSLDSFNDVGPSVVMASPGMLQSGVSRQLFDRWCSEDKNTVLIPGYSVEGTLAKKILSSPDEVTGMDGRVRPLKCSVEYISFSAHVDFVENKKFMDSTSPANIILVHGELNEMMRLKTELVKKYSKLPESQRPLVQTPRNCQEILLEFHRDKVAKAVGSMTTKLPESRNLSGLLVNRNFNNRLMSADDLESYTQLKLGGVRQSLRIPFYTTLETLQQFFREVYDDVSVSPAGSKSGPATLSIHGGRVTVKFPAPAVAGDAEPARLHFEWDAGPVTDMIADSLVALAMQAQTSAAGIRLISGAARQCGHSSHSHKAEESEEGPVDSTAIAAVEALMQERFGPDLVSADCESGKITIRLQPLSVDGDIVLQVTGGKNGWAADVVACGDEPLRVRLEESLKLWQEAHLAAM
jgi:cleavage and polyadenylation specificity factor subunit 3